MSAPVYTFNPPLAPPTVSLEPKPDQTDDEKEEERRQFRIVFDANNRERGKAYLVTILRNGEFARVSQVNCEFSTVYDIFFRLTYAFSEGNLEALQFFDIFVAESKRTDSFNVFSLPYGILKMIRYAKIMERSPLFEIMLPLIPDATWRALVEIVLQNKLPTYMKTDTHQYDVAVICLRWSVYAISSAQRAALAEYVRALRQTPSIAAYPANDPRHSAELITNVADFTGAETWPLEFRNEIMKRLVPARRTLCYREMRTIVTALIHKDPRIDDESLVNIVYQTLPCYDERVVTRFQVLGIIQRVRASAQASAESAAARNVAQQQ